MRERWFIELTKDANEIQQGPVAGRVEDDPPVFAVDHGDSVVKETHFRELVVCCDLIR